MEPLDNGPGPRSAPQLTDGGLAPWLPSPSAAGVARLRRRRQHLLAVVLFLLTFFTATTMGAFWCLVTRTDVVTDLPPWLGVESAAAVWSQPRLLSIGLGFSVPLLLILLCHELGHYLTCRRYGIDATPPYFLPFFMAFGTLGAFIRIRSPIRTKRELFDVGVAGPIAGFVALVPFLLWGVAHSQPSRVLLLPPEAAAEHPLPLLYLPGQSLGMRLVTTWFHGPLPEGWVLDLHPFALAAWVGLFATALNLLPLGQLDGGHIVYALAGRRQRWLALPLWLLLCAAGFWWLGWLFWAALVLLLGLRHPPVWDEEEELDGRRKLLAAVALALFVLSFMPVPLALHAVGL